ncbi:hypothetical protein SD71_11895 [Cohnella kolymensis]|uniref:Uncharacterized protein n=1 Tax=Cohnella kolymensis TaxID=1590652 RepID=A0ABR5A4N9_9BACL|nr:hypothetical protein [Cohnella kolymensis]KIL36017.1 hypothetical protein SD71_11895 [Cohnella kolymensis]
MSLFQFIFFSSLEYFGSFLFVLVQFRFSLRENISKIILISILLSFVSYSFINNDLGAISPLIQNLIFLIYIQVALKVSVTNSIIMVLTGYIAFGLVQTCIIAAASHVGLIVLETLEAATSTAYILQTCSFIMISILSFLTYFFKGGFSFIEARSRFSKNSLTGKNKGFIVYILIAFVVTLFSNLTLLKSDNPPYLLIASVLMLTLVIHVYMTLRRDETND